MRPSDDCQPEPCIRALMWRHAGRHLFRWTPYGAFGLRRMILRAFGARLTPLSKIRRSVDIDCPWNLTVGERTAIGDHVVLGARSPIHIGNRCTVSQLALLVTVAADPADPAGASLAGPITVHDDAWVATDVLVMPGVTIGHGAVVGARSLVHDDLPAWSLAGGDPARVFKERVMQPASEAIGAA